MGNKFKLLIFSFVFCLCYSGKADSSDIVKKYFSNCVSLEVLKLENRVNLGFFLNEKLSKGWYEVTIREQKKDESEGVIFILYQGENIDKSIIIGNINLPQESLKDWYVQVKIYDLDKDKENVLHEKKTLRTSISKILEGEPK